jgi:CO/xanthine dehydrogenase FAD-binding subunit
MTAIRYFAPQTLGQTFAELSARAEPTKIIAGGTDLIVQMRAGILKPTVIVDLRHLPLAGIREEEIAITIGALTTHTEILGSALIQRSFPALAAACRLVGGPTTRNRGTLGGNIMNASPAADAVPPLAAYDAEVVMAGPTGTRTMPIDAFFTGYRRTAALPGEVLQEIRLPKGAAPSASSFIKHGQRRAMYIATVSVAVRIDGEIGGPIQAARIALGSVAPTVIRAHAAEQALIGRTLTPDAIQAAAQLTLDAATPISDVRASETYRTKIVAVLVKRALENAWQYNKRM